MNLQAIILTNCIGFALLVILLISSHLVRQRQQLSDNLFTVMIVITAVSCMAEMFTFLIDGKFFPGVRMMHMLGDTYLYLANLFVSSVWCIYVDLRLYHDEKRIRKLYPRVCIPAIIGAAGIVLNLKFEFLFSIDEENFYYRQPAGYCYYLVTFGYLVYSMILRMQYRKKYGKDHFFPIYMFIVPIVLGATAQYIFYGISVGWCCTALGLVGIYMSLQNELSYIDPLTKLYNRNYLEHILTRISRKHLSAGGIMIDLDYFKIINDKYGHTVGDDALIEAAKIIRRSIPARALPIRFAGDEFIILLRTEQEEDMLTIEEELRKAVKAFNQEQKKQYLLSFSLGHSMYQAESSADVFLNQMDSKMYAEKKTKHSRSSVKLTEPAA